MENNSSKDNKLALTKRNQMTEAQKIFILVNYEKMPNKQMSTLLNLPIDTIRKFAYQNGLFKTTGMGRNAKRNKFYSARKR